MGPTIAVQIINCPPQPANKLLAGLHVSWLPLLQIQLKFAPPPFNGVEIRRTLWVLRDLLQTSCRLGGNCLFRSQEPLVILDHIHTTTARQTLLPPAGKMLLDHCPVAHPVHMLRCQLACLRVVFGNDIILQSAVAKETPDFDREPLRLCV